MHAAMPSCLRHLTMVVGHRCGCVHAGIPSCLCHLTMVVGHRCGCVHAAMSSRLCHLTMVVGHRCGCVHAAMTSRLCHLTMVVLFKRTLVGIDGVALVAASSEAVPRSGIPDVQQQSKKTRL